MVGYVEEYYLGEDGSLDFRRFCMIIFILFFKFVWEVLYSGCLINICLMSYWRNKLMEELDNQVGSFLMRRKKEENKECSIIRV